MDAVATAREARGAHGGARAAEVDHVRALLAPVVEAVRALAARPEGGGARVPRAALREVSVPVASRAQRVEGVREEARGGADGKPVVVLPEAAAWSARRWALVLAGRSPAVVLATPRDAAAHEFGTAFRLSVEAFLASHLLIKHQAPPRVDFVSSEALQDTFH
jgi:hypothetical protein